MRLLLLVFSLLALSGAVEVYPTKKVIHHRHRVYRHRQHQDDHNVPYVTYEDCCFDAVKGKNGSPPDSIRKHDCSSFMAPTPTPTTTTITVTSGVAGYADAAIVTAFHYPQPPEGCQRIPRYAAGPCKCDLSKYSSACCKWGITTGTNDQPGQTVTVTVTITEPATIDGISYDPYTTIDSAQTVEGIASTPASPTTIDSAQSFEEITSTPEFPTTSDYTQTVEGVTSTPDSPKPSLPGETTVEVSSFEIISIAASVGPPIPETTDFPSLEPSTIFATDLITFSTEEPLATTTTTTTSASTTLRTPIPTPAPHVPVSPLIRRCNNPLVCDNNSACSRTGGCLCQPSLRGEGFCLEDRPCSSLTTCQRDTDCEDGSVCMLTCCPEAKCLEMPWLCVVPTAPRRLFAKLARRDDGKEGLRVVRRALEGEVVLDMWTGHIVLDGKGSSSSGSSGFGL